MTLYTLILLSLVSAPGDLAARIDTLKMHLERLHAVTVGADDEAEKERKLSELEGALAGPIPDEETFNNLYRKIDEVRSWLLDHSASKPEPYAGTYQEVADGWELANDKLKVTLAKGDLSLRVDRGASTWQMTPCDEEDMTLPSGNVCFLKAANRSVREFRTGYSIGMLVTLSGFPDAAGTEVILGIHITGNEVLFEVTAPKEDPGIKEVHWPKAVRFDTQAEGDCTVVPLMQGAVIPANWSERIERGGLTQSRWFYMPWFGQVRASASYQAIIETYYDAGGYYLHSPGEFSLVRPHWYSSLGKLRYPRRIRYIFEEEGSYVSMAKRYRRYVQENEQFVSLKEKLARNPKVAEVIGKPVIHLGSLYHFVPEAELFNKERIENNHNLVPFAVLAQQLRDLKSNGIEDAYVHLDGWGFYGYDNGHPDVLPAGEEQGGWEGLRDFAKTCEDLGYLFAVHDQYRDFYTDAVSYNLDLNYTNADGTAPGAAVWCGGPQTFLSAVFAQGYVRRNHDLFAANGVHPQGAYLDVFAVADLDESFQRAHPMTREDCAKFRRSCFDLLRARGYVMSSEEPVDYAIPSLDLVHHGPYATSPHLGGGNRTGIPVPLFNLVYHDAILLPWEMGEDGGWGIPKGDAGRLHCLLNAGLPYVGPGASEMDIKRVNEAATLAGRLAHQEMVNHEFLNPSHRKQRTTYADGTQVTVDFDTKEYKIEPGSRTVK